MDIPVITATTAAVLLVMQQALMMQTGLYRPKAQAALGDNGDQDMARLMRRHGNLAENAALMLIGLAMLELLTGPTLLVKVIAVGFIGARVLHAVSFSSLRGSHALGEGTKPWLRMRIAGAVGTALCGFAAAVGLVAAVAAAQG
jgi:uncharacterized membrane protein YecN with MAPEG domain